MVGGWQGRRVCTPTHYSLPWLQHEMARHHYFVQYHLYLVALHRYLARRMSGYDIERHLGGAVYLFVRGMRGAAHPESGVFFDRPPSDVILALDELFEGQEVAS